MKSLRFLSSAFNSGDPGVPPKLKPFNSHTGKLSSVLWKGAVCMAAIVAVLSITPEAMARGVLKRGSAGPEVARLQAALGIHADGLFGRQTASAVASFQRACGLHVDGIAGPQTLSALFGGSCGHQPVADACIDPCVDPCPDPCASDDYDGYYDERRSSDDCEEGFPCYPPNRINQFGNRFPSRAYTGGQYVVVVPNGTPESLTQVRRYVPTAFPDATLAGSFINAGQFDDYATAARTVDLLEGVGFRAQVNYREYYR